MYVGSKKCASRFSAVTQVDYDSFWDIFQDKGNKLNYSYSFGPRWTTAIFRPKYDIKPLAAYHMFGGSTMAIDLVDYLADLGVKLDFSSCTDFRWFLSASKITRIGEVNFKSAIYPTYAFNGAQSLVTIDKLILKPDGMQSFEASFTQCSALVNVKSIEGTIANPNCVLWLTPCKKLSKASITNFVNALSSATTGGQMAFSKDAVNKAFATTAGGSNGSSSTEWLRLKATKSNWTILLQ